MQYHFSADMQIKYGNLFKHIKLTLFPGLYDFYIDLLQAKAPFYEL